MKNKVVAVIERCQMLEPGGRVLVAFSGGADSMALLHVLYELKEQLGIEVSAAHFNHGIRGEEAQRDERFCREFCQKLGVEFFVGRADIPALAKAKKLGLEECARQERYSFLNSVLPGAKIATAHSLSDCEETFLFNLARGSALKGLCSIPPVRENIIRPLISCSRAEIEAYCKENNLPFVTDSTNLSDEYTRNFLRHKIVPELKKINPCFDSAFSRCVESVREDEDLLSQLASSVLEHAKAEGGYLVSVLREAHPSLQKRAVAEIIADFCGERGEAAHIEAVCSVLQNGGSTQLPGGKRIYTHCGVLKPMPEKTQPWEEKFTLGLNKLPYFSVNVEFHGENDKINIQKINKELLAKAIDYDKIKEPLIWSSMREGDKIKPRGRGVTKPLRRVFSENGVEPALRLQIPVLRDSQGIVWVAGIGAAERVSVNEATERLLYLEV